MVNKPFGSIRSWLWTFIGYYPGFLFLFRLYRNLTKSDIGIVGVDTDLVIEGYPRSANTFAYVAFYMAQPNKETVIAHHLHAPAQIIYASCKNIPSIVLIRKPVDAIASRIIRNPHLDLRTGMLDYLKFYRRINPYRKQFVTAPFFEVIKDFGKVIRTVNIKFNPDFVEFDHTQQNVERCFKEIERLDAQDQGRANIETIGKPLEKREKLKKTVQTELQSSEYTDLLDQLNSLYGDYISDWEKEEAV